MPEPTSSAYVIVRHSPIHGTGVFAAKHIPKDTRIIEYVGEKISKDEADERGDAQYERGESGAQGHVYIFEINDDYDIDGNVDWNTARFINHSCDPNCEALNEDKHIWIIALRDIKKGEELAYNYGYDLEDFQEHPCRCGSENCVGYIVAQEHWPKLRKMLKKRERKGRRR